MQILSYIYKYTRINYSDRPTFEMSLRYTYSFKRGHTYFWAYLMGGRRPSGTRLMDGKKRLMEVKLPYELVGRSVGGSVGRSVGWSVVCRGATGDL